MEELQNYFKNWCTKVENAHNSIELCRIEIEQTEKESIYEHERVEQIKQWRYSENQNNDHLEHTNEEFEQIVKTFEQNCEKLKLFRIVIDQSYNLIQQQLPLIERYKTICEKYHGDPELYIQLQKLKLDLDQLYVDIQQSIKSDSENDNNKQSEEL